MKPTTIADIDADTMLAEVQSWCAINTGTANLDGLARQADILAEAFSALPGEIELVEPAPVTVVDADGNDALRNLTASIWCLRVRPTANRRILLTGHMDTVFPNGSLVPAAHLAR